MMNFSSMKGWAKHRTFGLRTEWIGLFMRHPYNWDTVGNLGSKQVVSFHQWLKTIGVRTSDGFDMPLVAAWNSLGAHNLQMWSLSWANIVHSWPVARLYVMRNYKTPMTTKAMVSDFMFFTGSVAERTMYDGVLELFSLLQHTPLGTQLGQGFIKSSPRTVFRSGDPNPPAASLCQSLINLFKEHDNLHLNLAQEKSWPWIVYGCDKEYAISQIITNCSEWLEITPDKITCKDIDKGACNVMGLLGLH